MAEMPNVLFLVVDSLRFDGLFGEEAASTPHMDTLVEEGISFDNCFSQGVSTAPSMTSILTGRLPLDYGGHWYLDDDQPTFAQSFNDLGYKTGAIHSNPYVSSRRNFDRGFDHFEEDVVSFEPETALEGASEKFLRLASRMSRILSRTPYTPAHEVNRKIVEFLTETARPWFLWSQYMDVHGPYLGGDDFSYRNKFRAERLWRKAAVRDPGAITEDEHEEFWTNYLLEIEYIDNAIGELLSTLEEEGEREDTIVIVTSDHGDEFCEHGKYGHGNLPYDELIHVPLIIDFPDSLEIPTEETVGELVRSLDILPTVVDTIGAELSDKHKRRLEGESLLPLIRGQERGETPIVITEKRVRDEETLRIGYRITNWKFIYDGETKDTNLFDLKNDPKESTDVSAEHPEITAEFRERLEERFHRIERTSENVSVPDLERDIGVDDRLKALGYLK